MEHTNKENCETPRSKAITFKIGAPVVKITFL